MSHDADRPTFATPQPRTGASIVRLRSGRLDLETFAPIFVELLGLVKGDATHLCQHESGILLDNIPQVVAEQVAAALQQHGEDCFLIPAADVVVIDRPEPVHDIRFVKQGVVLHDKEGHPSDVPYDRLAVLAISHVIIDETHLKKHPPGLVQYLGMGATSYAPLHLSETVHSSEMVHCLDLAGPDGSVYFRLDAAEIDFHVLGDQRQPTSLANLLTLGRWMLTYAPGLRSNIDAEALRHTGKAPLPMHSAYGLTQVSQWLVNLAKFGKDPLPPREEHPY